MKDEDVSQVVNVVEKSRIEEDGTGRGPWKETWKEVECQGPDKVSESMADFLWHEHGIEVEENGIEVKEEVSDDEQ